VMFICFVMLICLVTFVRLMIYVWFVIFLAAILPRMMTLSSGRLSCSTLDAMPIAKIKRMTQISNLILPANILCFCPNSYSRSTHLRMWQSLYNYFTC
jgi:hypothetical protein